MIERLTIDDEVKYLWDKVMDLNEILWDNKLSRDSINDWLENFNTDDEKNSALFLLSNFIYFNKHSIRQLLVALYRDLYRYPIIESIRRANGGTFDDSIIEPIFEKELHTTLFTIVGNISESSSLLSFDFRTENGGLNVDLFTEEVWKQDFSGHSYKQRRFLNRCVFIDDFCGTGQQILTNNEVFDTIRRLKRYFPYIKVYYYCLIGTEYGVENVRTRKDMFDDVRAVLTMDQSFKCFSAIPRIFLNNKFFDKNFVERMCKQYGTMLMIHFLEEIKKITAPKHEIIKCAEDHSKGFSDSQLLLGMEHNVPDNTLPIIWYGEEPKLWTPIFKRKVKKY